MTKWIFAVLNAISLILIVLLTSVEILAFNFSFYSYEYTKNNTYDQIQISEYDLMSVTQRLTDYMRDMEEDLVINVNINGQEREFFNDLEKAHMVDVKNLFQIAYLLRNTAAVIFFITLLCGSLYKKRPVLREYAKSIIGVFGLFIMTCIGFAVVAMSDFNKYFTIFHEIFFDNDMWILDPATDLLINIVPLPFFTDMFLFITAIFSAFSVILIILSFIYLKHTKRAGVRE
ncbi:MAG: TIGR01906 family membrane protein [Clostridiales bacterium]|nr:TIGR01906 family membrane protein [Clostridiales bacterium]